MTLAQEDLEEEGVGTEFRGMCLVHPMDWRYRWEGGGGEQGGGLGRGLGGG